MPVDLAASSTTTQSRNSASCGSDPTHASKRWMTIPHTHKYTQAHTYTESIVRWSAQNTNARQDYTRAHAPSPVSHCYATRSLAHKPEGSATRLNIALPPRPHHITSHRTRLYTHRFQEALHALPGHNSKCVEDALLELLLERLLHRHS